MNNNKIVALLLATGLSSAVYAESVVSGTWQLENPASAQGVIDDAIDGVVKEMNFFVRGIARSRLEDEATVCRQWTLTESAETFAFQCAQQPSWQMAVSASPTNLKGEDGRDITAQYEATGTSRQATLASERGERRHQWERQDERLIYRATIVSEKLPKPLQWTLVYEKVAP